ncbi:ATPase, T2SS/T4P/T4SS family [Paenibacillus gansuensis]|uniref:ATPase, T2SS/T4P/T4SS family n=1 Tax=Paenibacillus gansuensis TaxID=306542 RepID=A0ABW5PFU0_9BACL
MKRSRTRTPRSGFSLLDQLKHAQTNDVSTKAGPAAPRGYEIRELLEVVKIVQEELKTYETSLARTIDHKEIIHQAGLGNPLAQEQVKSMIKKILQDRQIYVSSGPLPDRMTLSDAVFSLSIGAGYIEDLYKDKDVEEVQVNDCDIYVMKNGISVKHARRFDSTEQVVRLQERLALYGRARINEQNPICHTYMYNRARLTMTQPNYSAFPTITIRNFILKDPSLDSLMEQGTLNRSMARFLSLMVQYHASIIVAGGTKTGKTTTLYALAKEIPRKERVLTLETEFEMMLHERLGGGRNIIPFQAVTELGISMEEAFKPLLRNSPDRIIVGEIRGAEASQAVQAALRGHDTMVTLHSKFRSMIVSDIMDMVKQDGRTHDDRMLRHRIARAFNIVVFQRLIKINEFKSRRVITEISEIRASDDGEVSVVPLYLWNYSQGEWERTEHEVSDELIAHMESYGLVPEQLTCCGEDT